MKYKINQLVRIKETGYVGSVSDIDDSGYKINASDWWYQENELEPATLYEVGDILVDEIGNEYKVLEVFPHTCMLGSNTNFDNMYSISSYATYTELKEHGYKLKNSKEEDVTELTLEDVAKKFKIDIDKLPLNLQDCYNALDYTWWIDAHPLGTTGPVYPTSRIKDNE